MRERREPLDSRGRWHSEGDPCRASGASPVTRHPVLLPAQGVQTSSWRFAVQTDIGWPLSTRTAHCHTPRTPRNAGTFVSGHRGTRMACHGGKRGEEGAARARPPERPGVGRSALAVGGVAGGRPRPPSSVLPLTPCWPLTVPFAGRAGSVAPSAQLGTVAESVSS